MAIRFLSLFAGIGGFDLGLERAGWQCVGQVEIDPFCRRVLAKHWPDVERFEDVRDVTGKIVRERCGDIDAIIGGFPCQPTSDAGRRKGADDDRWLWPEYYRLVCELLPRVVVVENPTGLLIRGFGSVLGDLAARGYDAEWSVFSAAHFGAPHIRERVFILAYPASERCFPVGVLGGAMQTAVPAQAKRSAAEAAWMPSVSRRVGALGRPLPDPAFDRVDDGFPGGLDKSRVKGVGNAVCPQVAEAIGRAILNKSFLS